MTRAAQWALVTGAPRRGGEAICKELHRRGLGVIVHHSRAGSAPDAARLVDLLNASRPGSALAWAADFTARELPALPALPQPDASISVLVCNASLYRPSDLHDHAVRDADLQVHLLSHATLIERLRGGLRALVGVTDIHVHVPHRGHLWYHVSKAALESLILTLSVELAPATRCNVVAPGALPWPADNHLEAERIREVQQTIPLGRTGSFEELGQVVTWLALDASYVNGSVVPLDGGRSRWMR
ncbi:SDR family oxidoreductase [Aquabacterium sp. A7-Y]|uniref:SDR family oxidoreductase n=1 Tax=Aquabacterium sp. A7-Y TaxID=1349605 RepID=UPI00223C9AEB|nr:SDR family oxidoreductase [Aquabacterium sp. A7-Y]MCW7539899.1 SDR family oxidoreductase [Aquabacterium sp. A7-Y]